MKRAFPAVSGVSLGILLISSVAPVAAQERLTGIRTTVVGPVYESWSFGGGLVQTGGTSNVELDGASQWMLPVAVVIPLGSRFTFDLSAAYASMSVKLKGEDGTLGTDTYSLSGLTDTKLRLTTKLAGDNVLFTIGINAPSGKTELDAEELAALRVMAAPALG